MNNIKTPIDHKGSVISICFSCDGNTIVSSSAEDNTIKIWNASTGNKINTLYDNNNTVVSLSISFDNKKIASCGPDCNIKIWDKNSGKKIKALWNNNCWIYSLCFFSKDNNLILSGSDDSNIKIWNI
jgi:WD40 repeat protein